MTDVLILQHVACEGPGRIATSIAAAGLTMDVVRIDRGEPVPTSLEARGLVVMGGPMGVYEADRHPHLTQEITLLRAAVRADRPVLGVCLGSQLLAAALGANVWSSGRQEIGWYDVTLSAAAANDPVFGGAPSSFRPLHWHGDIFSLPPGATLLASSAMTPIQAFSSSNAYGLLFHVEAEPPQVREMSSVFEDSLREHAIDTESLVGQAEEMCRRIEPVAQSVLSRWCELIAR